jgi:hypothetical protein
MQDHASPDVRRDEGGWISGPCLDQVGNSGRGAYYIEAEAEDRRLTDRLAAIRGREDSGQITIVQAAAERIAAMEQHLEALQELRRAHLEDGEVS